jgi:hypothetical protein
MKRLFLVSCLLVLAGLCHAQTPTAAAPQARAPMAHPSGDLAPNALHDTALHVAGVVDSGNVTQLWDGASVVTRRTVAREAFVEGVTRARRPLGAMVGREWSVLRRQYSAGGSVPAGHYASVEFVATFAGNRKAREVVSFRQDEDGVWRFTGYVIQ